MESSVDVAKKLAEGLNWKLVRVEDVFEIEEDKQGFFVVTLKAKKFLDTPDFKAVCALTRSLGGDGEYAKITRSWKLPGVLAKKGSQQATPVQPQKIEVKRPYFTFLPLKSIVPLASGVRKGKDDELAEFAESIREVGVLQSIIVRELANGLYECDAGDRRVAAAKLAGLTEIPAIVHPFTDEKAWTVRLIENVHRKDLADLEKAHALDEYMKTFKCTQEVLAKKLGKNPLWVSRHLSILELEKLSPGIVQTGEITERQAREILSASPEKREEILNQITKTGEVPSSRELHAVAHPTVKCDHCGEPVENPVHLGGKFYHDECAEQVKAEAEPSLVPGEATPSFDVSEENVETEETPQIKGSKASEKGLVKPEPLLTGYPFTCPDCGVKLIINHVDWPGTTKAEHRLEVCGA